MTRLHLASALVVFGTLLTACGTGGPDDPASDQQPFRDGWKTEHEGEFIATELDEDGNRVPLITDILVGNALGSQDNFVNRGDVIVEFNGEADTIKIEMRRFTFAGSEEEADDIFDKLELWAYNASTTSPKKPSDMDEADRCGGEDDDGDAYPWQEGCAIYVYYNGQSQLARAGADIRVTLPSDYLEGVSISTADNSQEDTYPNRGNVCISGMRGTADVELQNGLVFASIESDPNHPENPYPTCPEVLIEDCENFMDTMTMEAAPWAPDCGCINQGFDPGKIEVASLEPSSADITVDVPTSLWTSFRAENAGNNELNGKNCPATIGEIGTIEYDDAGDDPNKPWLRSGIANKPSEQAPAGGFRVDLKSNGCEFVEAVEEPKDWNPDDLDPEQDLRGNIEICNGCLRDESCEDLLPGN
jgi:hypothetical protein